MHGNKLFVLAGKSKSKASGNKGLFAFGIILLIIGLGLIFSSLDLSDLKSLDITFKSPAGEVTVDSFEPEEEQRIFVG